MKGVYAGGSFAVGVAILLAPWILRNSTVFDIPRLTTNDTIVLVYFTAAGAYQVEHGISREAAQQRISEEFNIARPEAMWNYHHLGLSPAELDKKARAVIPQLLVKYPTSLVRSSMLGVTKAFFSHDVSSVARMADIEWTSPRMSAGFHKETWQRLFKNDACLVLLFFVDLFYSLVLVAGMALGVIAGLVRKEWRRNTALFLPMLIFFIAVLGASGIDAYTRFRLPASALGYIFFGMGATYFLQRLQARLPDSLKKNTT